MPVALIYLIKLSISLAIVYLFYQGVLRRLTFYNWNRFYLLAYSLLAFLIPFIDISPVLQQEEWATRHIVQWVPVIGVQGQESVSNTNYSYSFTTWNLVSYFLVAGMVLLSARLMIQFISFRRIVQKARLLHGKGMKLYQVDGNIIPFSFGNAIFINPSLHTGEELEEIIRHEIVHVRQRHSVDIIWGELLCLLNWYNPFAWLLRRAIRQNLEFIADAKVLEYGVDPRQYQYLLLKVIGNNHFSIAPKFNFSSLKKRIAMMNKMKSAGVHLLKFLFILPFVAVLLIAFRKKDQLPVRTSIGNEYQEPYILQQIKFTDTIPLDRQPNSKGYLINVKGVDGNCVVIVMDKDGKEVERVLLTQWKEENKTFEEKYGEILPPPPTAPLAPHAPAAPISPVTTVAPVAPVAPVVPIAPCETIRDVTTPVATATTTDQLNLGRLSSEFEITDKKAVIKLRSGETETYDLTDAAQKAKFEKKYGRIYSVKANGIAPVALVGGKHGGVTSFTPAPDGDVIVADDYGYLITGNEDIVITITKHTTREELEEFKKKMKEKEVELDFDNMDFNDGKLIHISGTMKRGNSRSNFSASDFEKLVLAMIKKGDKTYFKVSTREGKVVI